jgi:hypothetical protein
MVLLSFPLLLSLLVNVLIVAALGLGINNWPADFRMRGDLKMPHPIKPS